MDLQQTPVMEDIFSAREKFKCVVAGRRFGKTYLAMTWLLGGILKPNQRRWVVMPTYRQGKLVALPVLKQLLRRYSGSIQINESDLTCKVGGAEIAIKGAEDPSKLRGSHLNRVVMDEYAYMKTGVWEEVIFPMMTTIPDSEALFIGTPDGFSNGFYDMYLKGQDLSEPDWKSWQFTTLDGGFVPHEEIERAKKTMDERTFNQEFLASFEASQNRCAYNFNRQDNVKNIQDETTNMWAGLDFNVSKMACTIAMEYSNSVVHYVDEICLKNSNTEEMAKTLRAKYPDLKFIYPDPAGSARSTQSSKSDHALLKEYGFLVRARKKHPTQRDRINALNRKLKDAEGNITMFVSPKCVELIKDLEQCQRDVKTGGIDKTDIERSHFLDACSYPLEYRFSVSVSRAFSTKW
tara:strand:- start:6633 stop:7850 length:1218 start_codon:yes stop_codon:yes gene_type:complete